MALESEDWGDGFGTSAEFSDDQSGYGLTWKADIGRHMADGREGTEYKPAQFDVSPRDWHEDNRSFWVVSKEVRLEIPVDGPWALR